MDAESGLYHDNPEYDDVVDRLSNDLFRISSANGQVAELLRRERRGDGSGATTGQQMALVQQNQQLFRQLKAEIEEMQQWEAPTPAQKYSQHKIAADFGRLFVEFRHVQEAVLAAATTRKPAGARSPGAAGGAIELEGASAAAQAAAPVAADGGFAAEQALAFEDQLAQDEVSYQQGLVEEREQEIENVAQGMNELNEIYMNLGTIVREQGVSLDNIEANLSNAATNVRGGADQLTKAHRWQRRSTGRMCAFLIILLVLGAFIALAIAVS